MVRSHHRSAYAAKLFAVEESRRNDPADQPFTGRLTMALLRHDTADYGGVPFVVSGPVLDLDEDYVIGCHVKLVNPATCSVALLGWVSSACCYRTLEKHPANVSGNHYVVSVSNRLAESVGLSRDVKEVFLEKLSQNEHSRTNCWPTLESVEIIIRSRFLSKRDVWRFQLKLLGAVVYNNMPPPFADSLYCAEVVGMTSNPAPVSPSKMRRRIAGPTSTHLLRSCGIVGSQTKVVFRTMSSHLNIYIHLSWEMWCFAQDGRPHYERALSFLINFLAGVRKAGSMCNHYLTLLTAIRLQPVDPEDVDLEGMPPTGKDGKFVFDDYYDVVYDGMTSKLDTGELVRGLRRMFLQFPSEIGWTPPCFPNKSHAPRQSWTNDASGFSPHKRSSSMMAVTPNADASPHATCGLRFDTDLKNWERGDYPRTGWVPARCRDSNVLECISLSADQFDQNHLDRKLYTTGQEVVVIAATDGVFRATCEPREDYVECVKRKCLQGVFSAKVICLRPPPMHQAPIILISKDQSASVRPRPRNPDMKRLGDQGSSWLHSHFDVYDASWLNIQYYPSEGKCCRSRMRFRGFLHASLTPLLYNCREQQIKMKVMPYTRLWTQAECSIIPSSNTLDDEPLSEREDTVDTSGVDLSLSNLPKRTAQMPDGVLANNSPITPRSNAYLGGPASSTYVRDSCYSSRMITELSAFKASQQNQSLSQICHLNSRTSHHHHQQQQLPTSFFHTRSSTSSGQRCSPLCQSLLPTRFGSLLDDANMSQLVVPQLQRIVLETNKRVEQNSQMQVDNWVVTSEESVRMSMMLAKHHLDVRRMQLMRGRGTPGARATLPLPPSSVGGLAKSHSLTRMQQINRTMHELIGVRLAMGHQLIEDRQQSWSIYIANVQMNGIDSSWKLEQFEDGGNNILVTKYRPLVLDPSTSSSRGRMPPSGAYNHQLARPNSLVPAVPSRRGSVMEAEPSPPHPAKVKERILATKYKFYVRRRPGLSNYSSSNSAFSSPVDSCGVDDLRKHSGQAISPRNVSLSRCPDCEQFSRGYFIHTRKWLHNSMHEFPWNSLDMLVSQQSPKIPNMVPPALKADSDGPHELRWLLRSALKTLMFALVPSEPEFSHEAFLRDIPEGLGVGSDPFNDDARHHRRGDYDAQLVERFRSWKYKVETQCGIPLIPVRVDRPTDAMSRCGGASSTCSFGAYATMSVRVNVRNSHLFTPNDSTSGSWGGLDEKKELCRDWVQLNFDESFQPPRLFLLSIDWVTCHANYVVQIVDKLAQCAAEEGFTLVELPVAQLFPQPVPSPLWSEDRELCFHRLPFNRRITLQFPPDVASSITTPFHKKLLYDLCAGLDLLVCFFCEDRRLKEVAVDTDEDGHEAKQMDRRVRQLDSRLTGWTTMNRDGTFFVAIRPGRLDWYESYLTSHEAGALSLKRLRERGRASVTQHERAFAKMKSIVHTDLIRFREEKERILSAQAEEEAYVVRRTASLPH
ncbi:GATOR complex protein depdc5 [Perkinsus olseni]|uniref:GATOR complex protein depdc5 n=1 Tax=Perkinsus olseni TaxID=32597 RepID=A0A7J6MAK3_PEROL|nr:GATOR complex protein depdc5 [Perkinsus olseni]KAF4674046.1 GATOR complex protein depdc5 [Perkinsus olseni]